MFAITTHPKQLQAPTRICWTSHKRAPGTKGRRPCPRAERRRHRGGRGLQRPGGGAGAEGWVGRGSSRRFFGSSPCFSCPAQVFLFFIGCSPPNRKGLLDFMLESAFAMLLNHAPTQFPARELLASGSRRVSRQSCSSGSRECPAR